MNVKNQHYVWRFYLQSWAVNDQLFFLRSGETEIKVSNIRNVAAEKYFYRTEELNQKDFDLIEEFVLKPSPAFLQSVHRNWLRAFNMPFRILRNLKGLGFEEEKIEQLRMSLENNVYENLLSEYEDDWKKFSPRQEFGCKFPRAPGSSSLSLCLLS